MDRFHGHLLPVFARVFYLQTYQNSTLPIPTLTTKEHLYENAFRSLRSDRIRAATHEIFVLTSIKCLELDRRYFEKYF